MRNLIVMALLLVPSLALAQEESKKSYRVVVTVYEMTGSEPSNTWSKSVELTKETAELLVKASEATITQVQQQEARAAGTEPPTPLVGQQAVVALLQRFFRDTARQYAATAAATEAATKAAQDVTSKLEGLQIKD